MLKKDAIEYIESYKGKSEHIKDVMACFGNVQDKLNIIHVAGSNGKGSVCSMLSSVLKQANYKVGTFISPHLIEYNERFLINGKCISDSDFITLTKRVKDVCDKGAYKLTFFEILTCIGFLYFYEQKCDVVVLEVGLGGRLDATNVISKSTLSIITNIGLEHTEILGDTLTKIALEKAGIIKDNGDVLVYNIENVLPVYERVCSEKNAKLYKTSFSLIEKNPFSYKAYKNIELGLKGDYQYYNASLVLDAIDILNKKGFIISENAVRLGLKDASWPARMSILSHNPLFIIDGAHNVQCIKALTASLPQISTKKLTFVVGILKDKDYKEMLDLLFPYAKEFVCVKPNSVRAIEPSILAEYIKTKGFKVNVFESVYKGIEYASYKDCVVCGSLYLGGEAMVSYKKLLRKRCKEKIDSLNKEDVVKKSNIIVTKIKNNKQFQKAKNIMIYKAFGNEIDLSELEKETKIFSYPVCLDGNKIKAVIPKKGFYLNDYGIEEPIGEEMTKIDMIICPLLGFDLSLNRIGYGKGYYDRFLDNRDCFTLGVAYESCKVEKIPENCFDAKLDTIYSEEKEYNGI